MARRGRVVIDQEVCKGCLLCVHFCPMNVLEAASRRNSTGTYPSQTAHLEKCTACGNCFEVCPDLCITVYAREGEKASRVPG
ncbi:MAG: 4Fe-4S binding protein [Treponema sp.]|jgi:2-oxoglutarate ferredoxin oxidoreductase subunit delta|nr:4Fe-4S binding protein [Treponema sp.]